MWNYYNPVEIIFGEKKFSSIESILENKKYIIITHPEDIFKQYSDQLTITNNGEFGSELIYDIGW